MGQQTQAKALRRDVRRVVGKAGLEAIAQHQARLDTAAFQIEGLANDIRHIRAGLNVNQLDIIALRQAYNAPWRERLRWLVGL